MALMAITDQKAAVVLMFFMKVGFGDEYLLEPLYCNMVIRPTLVGRNKPPVEC